MLCEKKSELRKLKPYEVDPTGQSSTQMRVCVPTIGVSGINVKGCGTSKGYFLFYR